jgi:deoxyribonuclease V
MLQLPELPDLTAALNRLLLQIPPDRVTTFGSLAVALGDHQAARWVAASLANCRLSPLATVAGEPCPCVRVVRLDGQLGTFGHGDLAEKVRQLRSAGIAVEATAAGPRVSLPDSLWREFSSDSPLQALSQWQVTCAERICLTEPLAPAGIVVGLDVAYPSPDVAVGAAVVMEAATQRVLHEQVASLPCRFPYVPGYLAFRELPVLLELWQQLQGAISRPQYFMVDGNGILHPRRAGLASVFGVLTGIPTIGVGKSLLCGKLEPAERPGEPAWIRVAGELRGACLASRPGGRPIYVSPGHRMGCEQAVQEVQRWLWGKRLPEPLHRADRLTRAASVPREQD